MISRLGRGDLVLSHFSLAPNTPLETRVAAAAGAGFAGIGWYVGEYAALPRSKGTDSDILAILRSYGMVLHEVDALPLERLERLDDAVRLARLTGAHHVQVQGNRPGTVESAAVTIASIADRLEPDGIGVAIEFIGSNNIATASDALELAVRSARPNVGVQVDVWHHVRGANDWSLLEALPKERLLSVQLDDGPAEPVDPDYLTDTVHYRRVPGAGDFDLVRFLDVVYPPSVDLPLSLEVISDDLLSRSPAEAARLIADATRALLRSCSPGSARVIPGGAGTRPSSLQRPAMP